MKKKTDLLELIKECINVDNQIAGKQGSERLFYSVGVFLRQELSAITLYCICEPVPRPEIFGHGKICAPDFTSGFVIARGMYETVLISNYILLAMEFDKCRNLILKVARLHSLRERIRFGTNMKSKNPQVQNFEQEAGVIEEFITSHPEFEYLPNIAQKFVKKSAKNDWRWHDKGMEQLAENAGFHKTWHTQYYGFLSNYAHASPLSVEQVGSVRSPDHAEDLASILPDYAENFLSRSLEIHLKICETEKMNFQISEKTKMILNIWKELNSEEMATTLQI